MFTGIIEELGEVTGFKSTGDSTGIVIRSPKIINNTKQGDSIAVNGVCLTVTGISAGHFTADISPETLRRSNLSALRTGIKVNLERALKLSDRLGGHIVSGHIDGTGTIKSMITEQNSLIITIAAEHALMKYMAFKGSVAVDGISLTIAGCSNTDFKVAVIPFTLKETTLSFKKAGDTVNIECDLLCKYVERLLAFKNENAGTDGSGITGEYLAKMGF